MMREFGNENRISLAPAASSSEPAEAACPVHRKPGCYDATGRVDVHRDFLLRIVGFEEQKLRNHQGRHAILDRPGHEDDALFQQARENIVGAFTAVGLFDDHRDEVHIGFNGIAHESPRVGGDGHPPARAFGDCRTRTNVP
jgi:hypothetical protein